MKRLITIVIVLLLTVCIFSGLAAKILEDMNLPADGTDNSTGSQTSNQITDSIPGNSGESESESESESETEPSPPTPILEVPELNCSQVFIYDVDNDVFLYERGTEQPIIPASITKLLTALCALHYMPADELITPGDELALLQKGSSTAYVKSNHTLTLEMLIEGMLLPSGNDAAFAVAAGVARYLNKDSQLSGTEAIKIFMDLANDYAKTLGCTATHFTVPDGLAYEGHTSTAHDLTLIGKAALKNELITKYASTVSEKVIYASGHTMTWKNTNPLIDPTSSFYSPYVTGLKTGSLTDSYSVMVSADIGDRTFLMGFFGAPTKDGRYQDALTVLDLILEQTA